MLKRLALIQAELTSHFVFLEKTNLPQSLIRLINVLMLHGGSDSDIY